MVKKMNMMTVGLVVAVVLALVYFFRPQTFNFLKQGFEGDDFEGDDFEGDEGFDDFEGDDFEGDEGFEDGDFEDGDGFEGEEGFQTSASKGTAITVTKATTKAAPAPPKCVPGCKP